VCNISEQSLQFLKVKQLDPLNDTPSSHGASV
jgi:hypothetical protein